jgi:hypothetical protein
MSATAAPSDAAPALDREALEAECAVFARHLAGVDPPAYVVATYLRAHEPGRNGPLASPDEEEDPLVHFARGGAWSVRLADAWAAAFDRAGPLRRKLILLLAILESGKESDVVDRIGPGEAGAFVRGAFLRAFSFAATLAAAAVVIGPRALVWGRRAAGSEES